MKIEINHFLTALQQISIIADTTTMVIQKLVCEHDLIVEDHLSKQAKMESELDRLFNELQKTTMVAVNAKIAEVVNNNTETHEGTPRKRKYHLRRTSPEANHEPGVCLFCNGPTPSPERKFCSTSHQVKYAHQQNGHAIKEQPKQEDPPQTPDHSKN